MDPAETVLEGALENHYKMIKQMKGETLDRTRGSLNVLGSLLPIILATIKHDLEVRCIVLFRISLLFCCL